MASECIAEKLFGTREHLSLESKFKPREMVRTRLNDILHRYEIIQKAQLDQIGHSCLMNGLALDMKSLALDYSEHMSVVGNFLELGEDKISLLLDPKDNSYIAKEAVLRLYLKHRQYHFENTN